MARATTPTKLSLDEFARIMGMDPIHFNQCYIEAENDPHCTSPWFQHEWQDRDRVGREEVARAIAQAEADIENFLGYRLLPSWEEDEWKPTARSSHPEIFGADGLDVRGLGQIVKAQWGWFVSGGRRATTVIEAAAAIVWSDDDGDGLDDMATVTVATSLTDTEQVRIFYPGEAAAPEWEIRPRTVVISGGVATITFRRELAVLASLQEVRRPSGVDYSVDANFLATVDVYRVYNDPQTQVNFLWEPWGGCSCNSSTCTRCSYSTQTGCLIARRDPKYGLLAYSPADWNADDEDFDDAAWALARQPDMVRLWYFAGYRDNGLAEPRLTMDPRWARTIAYLAAARLDRDPCDCAAGYFEQWRQDMSFEQGAEQFQRYRISARKLNNPIGTRRGEIYAWDQLRRPGISKQGAVIA